MKVGLQNLSAIVMDYVYSVWATLVRGYILFPELKLESILFGQKLQAALRVIVFKFPSIGYAITVGIRIHCIKRNSDIDKQKMYTYTHSDYSVLLNYSTIYVSFTEQTCTHLHEYPLVLLSE